MTGEEQQIAEKIIIPIVVAIISAIATTLLVEYFAKPKLEARKARLIRDRQQIDEVIFKFQKVSLSLAALLPDSSSRNHIQERHNKIMLDNAAEGLYDLMESISRLSYKYAQKHSSHISKTSLFIGYLLAKVEAKRTAKTMTIPVDDLKKEASDLEFFDVYFVANVGLRDSQEKWFRRVIWNTFSKKNSSANVDQIIEKYNLGVKDEK